jgi:Notch-like protein
MRQDDDCDGRSDEGVLNACGACGAAPAEACNARDEDCDGRTDEGVTNACGGCGAVPAEACNAQDDDCDGRTDEGVSNACGGCGPLPAEVCNGIDEDCDGRTDENPTDVGGACSRTLLACQTEGTYICSAGALGCNAPAIEAVPEVCNGRDDDCDGTADNPGSLAYDFDNCGACGRQCDFGRADGCSDGQCTCGFGPACRAAFECINGVCCRDGFNCEILPER